jgi:hypothetical protein
MIGYFKLKAVDHLIVLSIQGDQRERFVHCCRRDNGIEHVKPVRFCTGLQEPVGEKSSMCILFIQRLAQLGCERELWGIRRLLLYPVVYPLQSVLKSSSSVRPPQ